MIIEEGTSAILAFFALVYLQDVDRFPFLINVIICILFYIIAATFFFSTFKNND
ncbi:MAG: hypothetical protein QT11_C0001G1008 [archaeon GW2011_AR20]|nr:MAG: hypothetical protein QT11_C0001G1008 [archaeon GW2011_AR20]MBS3161022.1 hypothetical protein [Candidatus Woesearchaeota archaeon]